MKTLLALVLCASSLNVLASELPKDTVDKYVIDNVVIDRFNGTQLENKTIAKYIIACKDAGNVVERNHVIITEQEHSSTKEDVTSLANYKGLIILNGKEVRSTDVSLISSKEVRSVFVLKPDSKAAEVYGEKGKNGVMIINTIKASADKTVKVVYIDGQKVDESEMNKLSPNNISAMSVAKNKDGKPTIIYIETKQDKKDK